MNIDLIGYFGMVVIAISLIPQVIKAWKTKSTSDISIVWNSIYVFGILIWLVYAIGISSQPLLLSCIVEGSLAFSLLILKVRYG